MRSAPRDWKWRNCGLWLESNPTLRACGPDCPSWYKPRLSPYNGSALQDSNTAHLAVGTRRTAAQGNEMAAVLTRAFARGKRSVSGSHLRSVLAGHGPFSSEAATTAAPAAAVDDRKLAATGEDDGDDDLRSRIFRLGLAKRSATAALEKWSSEGRAAPAAELRRIARDLSRVRRYKHALEVRSPAESLSLLIALPAIDLVNPGLSSLSALRNEL